MQKVRVSRRHLFVQNLCDKEIRDVQEPLSKESPSSNVPVVRDVRETGRSKRPFPQETSSKPSLQHDHKKKRPAWLDEDKEKKKTPHQMKLCKRPFPEETSSKPSVQLDRKKKRMPDWLVEEEMKKTIKEIKMFCYDPLKVCVDDDEILFGYDYPEDDNMTEEERDRETIALLKKEKRKEEDRRRRRDEKRDSK